MVLGVSLLLGVPACTVGGVLLLYSGYLAYVHKKYSHIPSPRRSSFFSGNLSALTQASKKTATEDTLFSAVQYWLQEVDSHTFVVFFFHVPMVITVDPKLIKNVILDQKNNKTGIYKNTFGSIYGARFMLESLFAIKSYEPWKPYRVLYDTGFEHNHIQSLIPVVNESLEPTLRKLNTQADGVTQVPMGEFIKKLALEATSLTIYGTSFSSIWTPESLGVTIPPGRNTDVMTYVIEVCMSGLDQNQSATVPALNRFLHPFQARKYRSCVAALRRMGRDCLLRRMEMIKNKEELPKDALTQMLLSNDRSFDVEQFMDTFCNVFPLGCMPMSYAIQIAFILLHQHPNVLEKVQQEVESVLGSRTEITADDLAALKYTEKVFYEALRYYYVAPGTTRELHQDTNVGEFTIPSGSTVMIGDSSLYRLAEFFPDPDTFKPERFENQPIPSLNFCPFGQGPRSCLGKEFCVITAKMILAKLVQNYTINFPQDYKIAIVRDPAIRPREDFICTLKMKS